MSDQATENPLFVSADSASNRPCIYTIDTKLVTDPFLTLKKQLFKYEKAKRRALEMSKYLKDIGENRLSLLLQGCGSFLLFHAYPTIGRLNLVKSNFCKCHLLDPLCSIRRGVKYARAYSEKLQFILEKSGPYRLQLVTWTVKNGPDLQERVNHLFDSRKKLTYLTRNCRLGKSTSEMGKVLGCVGSLDVTNIGNGWHPHLHEITITREGLDKKNVWGLWEEATGDSTNVDISDFKEHEDPIVNFLEAFKYAIAIYELTLEQNFQAYQVLKNRRKVYSQGLFRGVKVPESLTDDVLADLPYIELLYRYYEKKGYNLERFFNQRGKNEN